MPIELELKSRAQNRLRPTCSIPNTARNEVRNYTLTTAA